MTDLKFQMIDIESIQESEHNNRKHFNEKRLAELADSIEEKGILTPLLVRPVNGPTEAPKFEIAAGARRLRAAKMASLKELPAIVRVLDDKEFREILVIENVQREDVHPLEEGEGYRDLIAKHGHDTSTLADKVGKSESYILRRMKLTELIEAAKEAFWKEEITLSHAILLARLQPKDQADMLEKCADEWGNLSARELRDIIEYQIHLDLNSVNFSKKDAKLLPEAGACVDCAKRTGYTPALFPEIDEKDTCTDPACFHAKKFAHVGKIIEKHSEDGKEPIRVSTSYGMSGYDEEALGKPLNPNDYLEVPKKGPHCEHEEKAVVVHGHGKNEAGKIITICRKKGCKVHRGRIEVDNSYKEQQKKEKEKKQIKEKTNERILEAFLNSDQVMKIEGWRLVTLGVMEQVWQDWIKQIGKRRGLEPVDMSWGGKSWNEPLKELIENSSHMSCDGILFELALLPNEELLRKAAEFRGVDVQAIEKEVKAEFKKKKKPTKKKPAKKSKKSNKKSGK